MVHVVIVGGSGNVGREIVEELKAQGKHEITVFSRKDVPELANRGIEVEKIDYTDSIQLVEALKGVHTVLSFVSSGENNEPQKTLVDACIAAGVKRFAPSEWGPKNQPGGLFQFKCDIHEYLKQVNSKQAVLEYCLFQPGIFMNYIAAPHRTAKYLFITGLFVDLDKKRAIKIDDGNAWEVYTTIQDVAKAVCHAIDYPGQWPEIGGMAGSRIQTKDLIKIAETIKGNESQPGLFLPLIANEQIILTIGELFEVTTVKGEDLAAGVVKSSWMPRVDHPSLTPEIREQIGPMVLLSCLRAVQNGDTDIEPVWNNLLPEMKFTGVEAFLEGVFRKGEGIY
ncbi:hypothetical protein FQN57_007368 [Myotisia sp. PD_48]|nr:hypothetical protein FQN57_007368 [Myotisia sp. PD_48]